MKNYIDSIEKENLWLVDEDRAVGLRCDIQKNEVIIDVPHDAKDDSWIEYDKGAACKKINLEACTKFIIERTFIKYDGKIVDKYVRKESVKLSDFKKSILTYIN